MGFLLKKIITSLVLPPISFLILAIFGVLVIKKIPRLGRAIALVSLILTLFLSLPVVSSRLAVTLQSKEVLQDFDQSVQAIVVLGGGVYYDAPEYQGDNITSAGLERIKYAAWLFDKTGLPILVSGGDPRKTGVTEASVMKKVLEDEFLTPVKWIEDRSKDSYENAQFSYEILAQQKKTKIYLVTHAWHMLRSEKIFRQHGFDVVPAPTVFLKPHPINIYSVLPSAQALQQSAMVFHEWFGDVWYWFLTQLKGAGLRF